MFFKPDCHLYKNSEDIEEVKMIAPIPGQFVLYPS